MLFRFIKYILQGDKRSIDLEKSPLESTPTLVNVEVLKFFIYNEKGDWNEKMKSQLFPLLDEDIEVFDRESFRVKKTELEELSNTHYQGLWLYAQGGYPLLLFFAGREYQGKSFKSDFDKLFKKGNTEEFVRIINKNARKVAFKGPN